MKELVKFGYGYQRVEWSFSDGSHGYIGDIAHLNEDGTIKNLPPEIKAEVFGSQNVISEHLPAIASGVGSGYSGRYMKVPAIKARLTAMGKTLIIDIYHPTNGFRLSSKPEKNFHY